MHPQTAPIGLAPAESPPAGSAAVDRLGRWSSALALGCALHCLAMPLVLTFLPLASTAFRLDHGVERLLVGASALLGSASLCWGFRRHRRHGVLLLLAVALAAIAAGLLATHRALGGGAGHRRHRAPRRRASPESPPLPRLLDLPLTR